MVLASNSGIQLKSGYVNNPGKTWRDQKTWKHGDYTISNFKGTAEGIFATLSVFVKSSLYLIPQFSSNLP